MNDDIIKRIYVAKEYIQEASFFIWNGIISLYVCWNKWGAFSERIRWMQNHQTLPHTPQDGSDVRFIMPCFNLIQIDASHILQSNFTDTIV